MSRIEWDKLPDRLYETGVDRGVLYLSDGSGVPWNGLISVVEDTADEQSEPLYIDGSKYSDRTMSGEYSATLSALTYPDEFLEYEGYEELGTGLYSDDGPIKTFNMSYRTLIGNGTEGTDYGYKVHILYNLSAIPSNTLYGTISDNSTPTPFSWNISGVPEFVTSYRPTAHVILDMTELDPYFIVDLETMLYGNESQDAQLLPLSELSQMAAEYHVIDIIDHGDGTWSADGPDELITMLDGTTFRIEEVNAVYLDEHTYEISST